MFWRVLQAEALKLKRTVAVRLAVLAPLVVVVLILFMASQMPHTILRRPGMGSDWAALSRISLFFWGLLMLPLYVTVEASLVAGIDHAESQWKALLTRPIPRYAFYVAKLIVTLCLTVLSTLILIAGIGVTGLVLPHLQATATFKTPVPLLDIVEKAFVMTTLAAPALSIQHWISLRWRAFAVPTGVGIVSMVLGYGMVVASQPNGSWTQWFPWSLPMLALAAWPVPMPTVLAVSTLAAIVAAIAGCLEFSSREVI